MRIVPSALVLAALSGLLAPAPARAEWQFAPFVGYTFKGATTLDDPESGSEVRHWHFGGAVTLIGDSPLGVEAYYLHTPGFFQNEGSDCNVAVTCITNSRSYALMGNVVLATPRSWNRYGLRPYVSGGLGLLHASRDAVRNVIPIDLNLVGMNVGGGAVGFVSERVGVRFDLRYLRKVEGPDEDRLDPPVTILGQPIRLRYWTTSFGVVIKY